MKDSLNDLYEPLAAQAVRRNCDLPRFASHLRSKRRTQHWTVRGMAKAVGISAAQYSRWENMKSVPTLPDFIFLCWLFDLNPLDYFIHPEGIKKTELMLVASEARDWRVDDE